MQHTKTSLALTPEFIDEKPIKARKRNLRKNRAPNYVKIQTFQKQINHKRFSNFIS